jgi:hypothetical protein
MGSSLSPIISNIYMEHFKKLVLESAQYKPSLWLQYVDDTFVVWPHAPDQLQYFRSHLNSLRPSIQFTMETESHTVIPNLDVLVIRKKITLATEVYRKNTHTDRYLKFKYHHLPHVKRSLIQGLHNEASTISSLRHDFQLNAYPQGFTDSVINSKGSSWPNKEEKPLGSAYIPYVKGASEKFKCTGNWYSIRISSKLNTLLVHSWKLTQKTYEEGHRVGWDEARNLQIESNTKHRKYNELAHMAFLTNQSANPVWTLLPSGSPVSAMRLATHKDQYDVTDPSRCFYKVLVQSVQFLLHRRH